MKKIEVFFLLILFIFFGCSNSTHKKTYSVLSDGKYDNGFPIEDCSQQLEEISKSVKKINCYIEYDLFRFSYDDNLTTANFDSSNRFDIYHPDSSIVEAGFGTATIIYSDYQHQVLLTCAHVLDYIDTIYSYYSQQNLNGDQVLAEVLIKKKQQFFIKDGNRINQFNILEMDKTNDIAFLLRKIDKSSEGILEEINYPVGKSSDLKWGDFVYIMGFPSGVQMVTKGIVSKSAGNKSKFLIDALFNKGFSGGIVLAVRDGVPNFEIVGMIKSASVTSKNILIPNERSHEYINTYGEEYSGKVYKELDKRINYGIAYATSIDAIIDFYKSEKKNIKISGVDLDSFFYP